MATLQGILRYTKHVLKHRTILFPGQRRVTCLLDLRIRLTTIRLLFWTNRFRMYQPIPFAEFEDIAPARSRGCDARWKEMGKHLPERMNGMAVLDIGAAEGYFGFQCAKRGACVTAVEFFPGKNHLMRLLAQRYELNDFSVISNDISEIDLKSLGEFDYIFYLNIHQHVYKRDPNKADVVLRDIGAICKKGVFFETRPVEFSEAVASLRPENPQPFRDIETTLRYVEEGTEFDQAEELFYEGFDSEPNHRESIPEGSENIYRLFLLTPRNNKTS